jgi:hypothetical protein
VRCPTNRGCGEWWMASRADHSILWSHYMSRGCLLRLSHPNLFA